LSLLQVHIIRTLPTVADFFFFYWSTTKCTRSLFLSFKLERPTSSMNLSPPPTPGPPLLCLSALSRTRRPMRFLILSPSLFEKNWDIGSGPVFLLSLTPTITTLFFSLVSSFTYQVVPSFSYQPRELSSIRLKTVVFFWTMRRRFVPPLNCVFRPPLSLASTSFLSQYFGIFRSLTPRGSFFPPPSFSPTLTCLRQPIP